MRLRLFLPLFLSALSLGVAACGGPEASGSFDAGNGKEGSYSVDADGDGTTAQIETPDGVATARSGANVPVDLPGGFSLYPGARVVSNTTFTQADAKGALVILESDASPQALADFYRKQASAAGIAIELEMSVNGGQMIGGQSEQGMSFSLNANREGETSTAQLMVGEKTGA